jgi:hypothetical protein
LCHPGYCVLFFDLAKDEQKQLPDLLRRLFRLPAFRTRTVRMGKVARIRKETVSYWEAGEKISLSLPD